MIFIFGTKPIFIEAPVAIRLGLVNHQQPHSAHPPAPALSEKRAQLAV
jgi:hypothetical protein